MIGMMNDVNDIAATVVAISEEQSASSIEVSQNVELVATSAVAVANESHEVDQNAQIVAESSNRIDEFISRFKID
ncbi:MAG: hypothetical protein K6G76_03205 [Lachnospiraceae bacterium]|nr:hypothetical protein [Lachnospiraceae bacterium]